MNNDIRFLRFLLDITWERKKKKIASDKYDLMHEQTDFIQKQNALKYILVKSYKEKFSTYT